MLDLGFPHIDGKEVVGKVPMRASDPR